ncbi:hypothetical protein JCM11491_002558 [Sporobolomyces phaffii]
MSQQPRIVLRPPPHRDYLHGYPGIPASDPSKDSPPTRDPLLQLPHLLRPQANLSGTVEIRSPAKGPPIRAKWLSLELEKIETIPPQAAPLNGAKAPSDKDKHDGKFVELIGTGPSRLWIAGEDPGARFDEIDGPVVKKRGFKGLPFKKGSNEDEEDDGFDYIPDGNYPFKIPLPEGLPPTTDVDSRSNGISYQLVASLCVKGKKGILKGSGKPSILLASASILLNKADTLPVFPAYLPILDHPIPSKLPWVVAGEPTVGEARESNLTIRRGFGGGDGTEGGEISMRVIRNGSAFGPGDSVPIFVELGWTGDVPIRVSRCCALTRLDFVLREHVTFRYPSANNPAYLVRAPPRTTAIFTSNANVSTDPDVSTAFVVVHKDEPAAFSLTGTVPASHMRVTVKTAKHIDVAYHLRIRAMMEGGDEIAIDQWPVVIGNVNARTAHGIIGDIGYVAGLCERPGVPALDDVREGEGPSGVRNGTASLARQPFANLAPPPAASTPIPLVASPATYSDASTEKRRLLEARSNGASFHVSNPTHDQGPSHHAPQPSSTPERPTPVRPRFAPSPTAEEEKRRYYEAATKSRDVLQGLHSLENGDASPGRDLVSPLSTDNTRYQSMNDGPALSTKSSVALSDPPMSPYALQEAAVLKLTRPHELSPAEEHGGFGSQSIGGNGIGISRSNTTFAASGSAVSTTFDDPSPRSVLDERSPSASGPRPSTSTSLLAVGASSMLGRSLTSAESEKKRLFLEAKAIARARQEEARLALERQNKVLEDFEFEEAQRDFEERLILEAEDERRTHERLEREAFERRLEAERIEKLREFERDQREVQEQRQLEKDRWARERKEEDEMKKRKAEELRRLDEENDRQENERRVALARKVEMERLRAEDEQRRLAGERARREEAEKRYEAERAAEEEEQRRQEIERRLQEEYERRLEEEEHRHRIEQERLEEEEHRRIYLEQVATRHRAEQEAIVPRQNSQQAYPTSYGRFREFSPPHVQASTSPQRIAQSLDRAPSVASFAPSTSAANADSTFYAQAIASGRGSALSEEKAEYLRQLRQGQSNGSVPSPPASHQQHQALPSPFYRDESTTGELYRGSAPQPTMPSYSSPPHEQDSRLPRSRSTTPTPSAYRPPPVPTSALLNGYKTAAEEKAEAAARRRLEDSRQGPTSGSISNVAAEDDDFAPPSYPIPSSSVGSNSVTPTSTVPRSAAAEKEELSAYYRAKQEVDANRVEHRPPPPETRQSTGPMPAQAYPSSLSLVSNGTTAHARPHQAPSAPPPPVESRSHHATSPASSSDLAHRDPEVALGKQRADTLGSPSPSYPESILRNYSQTPSAPPTHPTGYHGGGEYDAHRVGPESFASLHLETRLPEFAARIGADGSEGR